jgi:hypothetical protein
MDKLFEKDGLGFEEREVNLQEWCHFDYFISINWPSQIRELKIEMVVGLHPWGFGTARELSLQMRKRGTALLVGKIVTMLALSSGFQIFSGVG